MTKDLGPTMLRRSRKLELDQLVAGALILYPRYLDPLTGLPCPPEVFLDHRHHAAARRPGLLVRLRRAQGQLRRALHIGYATA